MGYPDARYVHKIGAVDSGDGNPKQRRSKRYVTIFKPSRLSDDSGYSGETVQYRKQHPRVKGAPPVDLNPPIIAQCHSG
ncbi:hypothetical protein GCM10008985_16460 [Halococcus dombrowskii]|uniref:Transposase n=1 Tax=Halococcus dombrowskii TaxID=179637 RepID=A0AAV3SFE0_HALDO